MSATDHLQRRVMLDRAAEPTTVFVARLSEADRIRLRVADAYLPSNYDRYGYYTDWYDV